MDAVISISEVVEKWEKPEGELEICATLESWYDRAAQQLTLQVGSSAHLMPGARPVPLSWLPAPETIREHAPRIEATEIARDVFHRWVSRVRRAVQQHTTAPA